MNGREHLRHTSMSPPLVTAEQILLYGKRQSRLIHLEANVIGYFGHIFRRKLAATRRVPRTLPL